MVKLSGRVSPRDPGGWGGYSHIKVMGVLVVPFRGLKMRFGTS